MLTAIALATVFYKPNFRSALWAVLGILVTVFIQAGMYMLMAPVGIATLTGPFCIATWLFLLPLIKFDEEEKPDHSNWNQMCIRDRLQVEAVFTDGSRLISIHHPIK